MVDEVGAKDRDTPLQDIREFKLGLWSEVSALQKGRVTRLAHPEFGTTYLIDVTDREDPTRRDPDDTSSKEETLGEVFKEDLENPRYNNRFASNNGVVATITDQLDPQRGKRVYVGVSTFNVDNPQSEITTRLLRSVGFTPDNFHVPFSFNPALVKEYMGQEVMDVVRESGNNHLFSDFRSATALISSGTT